MMVIYICIFWYCDVIRCDLGEFLYVIKILFGWLVVKFVLVKFEFIMLEKIFFFNCIFLESNYIMFLVY